MTSQSSTAATPLLGRTAGRRGRVSVPGVANNQRLFILVTVMPTIVLLGTYVFFPLLYSAYLSLFRTRLFAPGAFVGLQHYQQLFADAVFWTAFANTMIYTVGSVVLTLVLGLGAAVLLRGRLPGRDLFRAVAFLPYIIPYAAYALLWYWLFDPGYGLINYVLSFFGVSAVPWLKSANWVLPAFVLMSVWKRIGFVMVVYLAGLETIPSELYDAARIDGANGWQRFRYVTLPMLRPITVFVGAISLIHGLQLFVEPLVLTQGGPGSSSVSLGYLLYRQGFSQLNIGAASATAVVLAVITFMLTLFFLRRSEAVGAAE